MIRIKLIILFLCLSGLLIAQEVEFRRSGELIEMDGKKYYMHTVSAGQTLSSLSRLYGVTVAELMELNGKKDSILSLREVLQIPYVEEYKPVDGDFYYHKMRPKETLYSVSQKFGIRMKRLLKENPEYNVSAPIAVGAIVRLPLKQIDRNVLEAELLWLERQAALSEKQSAGEEMTEADVTPDAAEYIVADTLTNSFHEQARPGHIRMSMLLPFGVKESRLPYPGEIRRDSSGNNLDDERGRLYARSEPFRQFYGGWLIALDSLKKKGYTIELQLFEEERDSLAMQRIANEINRFSPHLIVGPAYAGEFAMLAGKLDNRHIPMIFPFSSLTERLGYLPNCIQPNTCSNTLLEEMSGWIARNAVQANLINLSPGNQGKISAESKLPDLVARHLVAGGQSMKTFNWSAGTRLSGLAGMLDPSRENMIILPTVDEAIANRILPELSLLSENYSITLIGFPDWLRFTVLDEELFFKLNVKMFQNNHIDYATMQAVAFTDKYRQDFFAEPQAVAFRAFDLGMFFVPLVDEYREQVMEKLETMDATADFTRFKFRTIPGMSAMENRGVYLIHYSSDFEIRSSIVY